MDAGPLKESKPEMAELPESWKTFEDGAPVPNWVAAVDEARRDVSFDMPPDRNNLKVLAAGRRSRLQSNGRPCFDLTDAEIERSTQTAIASSGCVQVPGGSASDPDTRPKSQ